MSSEDVMALLSPDGEMPVRLVGSDGGFAGNADPLDQALRAAIHDELLAHEAGRRGIAGVNRGEKISRLLEQEVRFASEDFDGAAVRAWYEDHRYLFDHVEAADLGYVVLGSPVHLDEVLAGLRDRDEDPEALVETYAAVDGGRLALSHDSEVPLMVERIVHAAKRPGVIGYDRGPESGNWWVVEIDDITYEPAAWSPALATKVEAAMQWAAEQERISSWASSLEEEWPVVVHEENIEQFEHGLRRQRP